MITVPAVVEKIIKSSPFLEDNISEGLINLSALSRKIKPEVEKQTLKRVNESSILMALKRYSVKIKPRRRTLNVFKSNPDMIVRSNLIEYTIQNSDQLLVKHKELLHRIGDNNKYFLTVTRGIFETTIISSSELKRDVEKIFDGEKIISCFENLSSITIKLPEKTATVPGIYHFILESLAWEGINVVEVVSTFTEFTLVLEDEEIDRAFSILKSLLSN